MIESVFVQRRSHGFGTRSSEIEVQFKSISPTFELDRMSLDSQESDSGGQAGVLLGGTEKAEIHHMYVGGLSQISLAIMSMMATELISSLSAFCKESPPLGLTFFLSLCSLDPPL
eukprot:scaffold1106_cov126-Cylindrotheca_fusiformis.AAC.8